MTERPLLPLADAPPERADAARNRDALLGAARALVAERGAACVTMEAVAAAAGVGKGTLFRRFGDRAGLMAALLDSSEAQWQQRVLTGPPPLGPGAPARARLLAFGRSRLESNLRHADLLAAVSATPGPRRGSGAHAFTAMHLRHLLAEAGAGGDLDVLAAALLAPLQGAVLDPPADVEALLAGWEDLVGRVLD